MTWRPLRRPLVGGMTVLLLAGCGDADGTGRAEMQLAEYRNDPLTSPIDIGLTLSVPPNPGDARRPDEDTPPPGRPGEDHARIEYWFEVPEGSDRDVLLALAADELVARGWELVVANDEIRVLTSHPSTDNLRATIVMPDSDSDRLVQEIRIQP